MLQNLKIRSSTSFFTFYIHDIPTVFPFLKFGNSKWRAYKPCHSHPCRPEGHSGQVSSICTIIFWLILDSDHTTCVWYPIHVHNAEGNNHYNRIWYKISCGQQMHTTHAFWFLIQENWKINWEKWEKRKT